jgi:hypothetical protein
MADETKWMKWQHTFAYGAGDEWEWVEVEDEDDAENRLHDLKNEYSWSDKYRGIEYTLHDAPDLEWLKKHIETEREGLRYQEHRIERLDKLLSSLQE